MSAMKQPQNSILSCRLFMDLETLMLATGGKVSTPNCDLAEKKSYAARPKQAAAPGLGHLIDQAQAEVALSRGAKAVGERQGRARAHDGTAQRRPGRVGEVVLVFELVALARYPRPRQPQIGAGRLNGQRHRQR